VNAPLDALRSLVQEPAWLVGGAVRDRLLGRVTSDYDVAVSGDPRALARALATACRGHPFVLSEGFGAWRVVARDRRWQVDLMPLAGESIESDLGHRDLTINAIAEPLHGNGFVDPFDGIADLRRRRLAMVSERAFDEDALRTMRVARLACELEFEPAASTVAAARSRAPGLAQVAPERVFSELARILSTERAVEGLELMDRLAVTEAVLPELVRLHGVEQSPYHHLDVLGHTRAVLAETIALERDPARDFGQDAEAIGHLLAEPFANGLTRAQALRFGALFHDIAKPQTREVNAAGRITFMGHDRQGAQTAREALMRLCASERLVEYVAALVRNHLRLGFLVHSMPLGRREVYRYLQACDPVQVDVTLLSVADRLATRGRGSEEAIARHLELARRLLAEALAWRRARPRPPVRGDDLARAVGLRPGPELGRLLAELEEASFAGEIHGREEAIEHAHELLRAER
jgi:poly(A) polymerase